VLVGFLGGKWCGYAVEFAADSFRALLA